MKKNVLAVFFIGIMMLGMAGTVQADVLASFTHDYGLGKFDPGGNDVLGNDFVTVSDQSALRFDDSFNFSGLNYGSVSNFNLTLSFSGTNNYFLCIFPEDWRVRPGGSTTALMDLNNVGSKSTQTFVIDSSVDKFNEMLTDKNFYFWFSDEAAGANNFKLYDAKLEIIGTPSAAAVPLPAAAWLLGSGLVGLAGIRKRANK